MTNKNAKMEIPVFLTSGDEFSPFVATTMASILKNTKSFIHFYILDCGISENNKQKIINTHNFFNNFSIEFIPINVDEYFSSLPELKFIPRNAYVRFLIPLLKPNLKKVIYSDIDVTFVGDIKNLYNISLEGYAMGAVESYRHKECGNAYIEVKEWLKIDTNAKLFISGLLLIDVEKWKADCTTEKLIKLAKELNKNNKLVTLDQDVLNKYFESNYLPLDKKYCIIPKALKLNFSTGEIKEIEKDVVIYHFTGGGAFKPWNNKNIEGARYFWKYVKYTDFRKDIKNIYQKFQLKEYGYFIDKFGCFLRIKKSNYGKEIRLFGIKIYDKKDYNLSVQIKHLLDLNYELKKQIDEQSKKLNNMKSLIIASTLHQETFAKYKNAFSGRDVVLVATGPSAKKYKPIEGAIHVGVNGAVYLDNIHLDFVFVQDNTINQKGNETLTKDVLSYSRNSCKKFIGIADQITRDKNINSDKKLLPIPLNAQTYNNVKQYALCGNGFTNDMPYDISYEPITNLAGTAFSAMQFILYTNPQRVYLVGCDCSKGYAYDINKENYIDLSPQINSCINIKKYSEVYLHEK